MIDKIKESLWRQFGASIDMLENVIVMSPEDFIHENKQFFYIIFHNLIFLDYYLTIPPKDFIPKLPFTIKEADEIPKEAIDDLIPVSYTHLDVYKRQLLKLSLLFSLA